MLLCYNQELAGQAECTSNTSISGSTILACRRCGLIHERKGVVRYAVAPGLITPTGGITKEAKIHTPIMSSVRGQEVV